MKSRPAGKVVLLVLAVLALAWGGWAFYWIPGRLAAGRAALAQKKWSSAVRNLETYIAARGDEVEPRLLIAEALAEQGYRSKAIAHLKLVPDDHPLGASARWHEASLLSQSNLAAQAERAARRSLELDPDSLDARQLLTIIYRWENRTHEAEKLLWEIYDRCAPDERVYALAQLFQVHDGQFEIQETIARLESYIANDPDDFDARLALARLHVGIGDEERATRMLEDCWRMRPADPAARAALVNCYVTFAQYAKATRYLETWPEPERDLRYWHSLGTYQSEYLQQYEPAVESFRRTLHDAPDDWRVRHRLAMCLRVLGRDAESADELHKADRAKTALDRDRIRRVLESLPNAIATADGRYEIGRIYEDVERWREAKSWYQEALAADSNHEPSRARLTQLGSVAADGS